MAALSPSIGFCGDNIWTSNGPPGASVVCIEIRPDNPNVVYAGTIQHGVYRSTDAGQTWSHFGEGLVLETMRRIACHPFAPDTMYCGAVYGMYKSTDSGAHWQMMLPPGGELGEYRALAVHPTSPNILLAGGPFDAWKSTDSGDTWISMTLPGEYGMEDIEFSMTEPNIVYLATQSNTYGKAVYKSTDTGDTWVNVHNDLDRIGASYDIEVDPTNSRVVYLGNWDHDPLSRGRILFKTTDGGQSWFDISPQGLMEKGVYNILVSPVSPMEIYACTVVDGVFKSDLGGGDWYPINDSLRTLRTCVIQHERGSGCLYLGVVHDGLYKLNSGGFWRKIGYDIHLSWPISLSCNPVNTQELLVTATNGLFKSPDNGETWHYIATSIPIRECPYGLARDKYFDQTLYLSSFMMTRNVIRAGFYKSTDNGLTWQPKRNGLPDGIDFYQIAISYFDSLSRRIFLSSESGLFYSDDMGESWLECAGGLPPALYYMGIDVSESDRRYVVAAEWYQQVFISTDGGDTWAPTSDLPRAWYEVIIDVVFDPFDPQTIYAASYPEALLKTSDGGQSWSDISGNLPRDSTDYHHLGISDIIINPHNSDNIFAVIGEHGIYQTHYGGLIWDLFDHPNLPVPAPYGRLSYALNDTASLHFLASGRSVWSIHRTLTGVEEDNSNLPQSISLSAYPNPFNSKTQLTYALPQNGNIKIAIYNELGQRQAILFNGPQVAGKYCLTWDATPFPSGTYFIRLQGEKGGQTIKMTLLK